MVVGLDDALQRGGGGSGTRGSNTRRGGTSAGSRSQTAGGGGGSGHDRVDKLINKVEALSKAVARLQSSKGKGSDARKGDGADKP